MTRVERDKLESIEHRISALYVNLGVRFDRQAKVNKSSVQEAQAIQMEIDGLLDKRDMGKRRFDGK